MELKNIKFKAKKLNNGEWVEGDFIHEDDVDSAMIMLWGEEGDGAYFVDSSTVCMYTGVTDSRCNKIWEGDIISIGLNKNCVVEWDCLQWVLKPRYEEGNLPLFMFNSNELTVIGNKFDKEE